MTPEACPTTRPGRCEASRVGALLVVVIPGLKDHEIVGAGLVDEPVFLSDPARPRAGDPVRERFGLADSRGRVSRHVIDQAVDALEDRAVGTLPVGVVLPPRVTRPRSTTKRSNQ